MGVGQKWLKGSGDLTASSGPIPCRPSYRQFPASSVPTSQGCSHPCPQAGAHLDVLGVELREEPGGRAHRDWLAFLRVLGSRGVPWSPKKTVNSMCEHQGHLSVEQWSRIGNQGRPLSSLGRGGTHCCSRESKQLPLAQPAKLQQQDSPVQPACGSVLAQLPAWPCGAKEEGGSLQLGPDPRSHSPVGSVLRTHTAAGLALPSARPCGHLLRRILRWSWAASARSDACTVVSVLNGVLMNVLGEVK